MSLLARQYKKILRVQQERGSRYPEKQASEPGYMWVFPPRASGKRQAGPGGSARLV